MAQATALEKGFAGPKDSRGRQVYPGFMFDTGIAATIPLLCGRTNLGPAFPQRDGLTRGRGGGAGPEALTATGSWIPEHLPSRGGKLASITV
jgi:feruloyl esterase